MLVKMIVMMLLIVVESENGPVGAGARTSLAVAVGPTAPSVYFGPACVQCTWPLLYHLRSACRIA